MFWSSVCLRFQFPPPPAAMTSEMYESGMCTLPRQHYAAHHAVRQGPMQSSSIAMSMAHPSVMYTASTNAASVNLVRSTAPGVLITNDPTLPPPPGPPMSACCIVPPPPPSGLTSVGPVVRPMINSSSPILVTKRESSVWRNAEYATSEC